MKIQENSNRQSSFGMSLKAKKGALNRINKYGLEAKFKNTLHELEELSKHINITIKKTNKTSNPKACIEFVATLPEYGENPNAFTRLIALLRNKSHYSVLDLEHAAKNKKKNYFVTKLIAAIEGVMPKV